MAARIQNNSALDPAQTRRRVRVVATFIVLWMFVIAGRLVFLQLFQHEWLLAKANGQQRDAIAMVPERGVVYDRQGRELARSVEMETLYADSRVLESANAAESLSPFTGLSKDEVAKRLAVLRDPKKKNVLVARKLDTDNADHIRALDIQGLSLEKEAKRLYPNGQLAAHILGFVGLDNDGLGGIEKQFDKRIHGEGGQRFVETDGTRRRAAYSSVEVPGKPGDSIVLTIDQLIQYRTEAALKNAMDRTQAKSIAAVVMDPRTGEILALANVPTFDPNDASSATDESRKNWALQNMYEPGSTFKAVAYSAAIEKKLVKPDDLIDCQMGAITVAGRLVHDHKKFGTLTISQALAQSSNVAAIKLGLKVGDGDMANYISKYGFGRKTGIELPGETGGSVRPVSRWQPSSMGSIAIGQEVGVTPIQMVAAYSAIANDGVRIAPHVIREIRNADGATVFKTNAEQHRVISVDTARQLRGMLEGVTLNGTARRAQLEGYSAAGKTGTAQKIDPATKRYSSTKFIGSFVGFAPVDNPSLAIIVVVDEPKGSYHGGDVAAPVFQEIAEQVLPEMDVAPDTELKANSTPSQIAKVVNPDAAERERQKKEQAIEEKRSTLPQWSSGAGGEAEIVVAAATRNGVMMPNLEGSSVKDAMRVCAQLGVHLEAQGDGRAIKQEPIAGTELIRGQTVRIEFGSSD